MVLLICLSGATLRIPLLERFAYTLMGAAITLYALVRSVRDREFRRTIAGRFYFHLDPKQSKARPRVWVHAASLGEFQGARPVLKELRAILPDSFITITTTSTTGNVAAIESKLADEVLYAPLDVKWVVHRAISHIRPDIVLTFETEIWPTLMLELRRAQIPQVLINGRISDRATGRYERFRRFFLYPLRCLARMYVQTELDAERFRDLVGSDERIVIAGSTKYDQPQVNLDPDEVAIFRRDFCLAQSPLVFTAGSLRPGEDEVVIAMIDELLAQFPDLGVIVAPRHENRFEAVAALLTARNLPFLKRSEKRGQGSTRILLLDTYGELARAYAVSDFAFVGGTLVPIGGHNPVEPALCGASVIVGPHVQNIRDAVETLRSEGALFHAHSAEELQRHLELLCSDGMLLFSSRENAKRIAVRYSGLSRRIVEGVVGLLNPQSKTMGATSA